MTTAIDTNILIALWDKDASLSGSAQSALDSALGRRGLSVAAPVFAELMACPGRDEVFLNSFFDRTAIVVDWLLDEKTWRVAGAAFQTYAARRRRQRDSGPRRILAGFIIGAHALRKDYRLLTLDDRLYRAAFPGLRIVRI